MNNEVKQYLDEKFVGIEVAFGTRISGMEVALDKRFTGIEATFDRKFAALTADIESLAVMVQKQFDVMSTERSTTEKRTGLFIYELSTTVSALESRIERLEKRVTGEQ